MIFTHNISPELFTVGPLAVRWYGLLFAAGLVLAYFVARWAFKKKNYSLEHLDSLVLYLVVGLVVGARFGHILFYESSYYFNNPSEIFKVWHGGLASHGATIGLFVAYLLWTKIYKVKFVKYPDAFVLGFPLAATFVRFGNFFNSEIVGKFTDGNCGVVFERLGENLPRHPAQLYEGFMSLLIFAVLLIVYKKYYKKAPPLFFMFLYILLYFVGRFIVEFWKDLHEMPDWSPLSMGQVLSVVPILIAIIYFVFFFPKQKKRL